MDTLNTGFIWEYDDNSFEEKNLLIDTLPEGFKYRVKKLKERPSKKALAPERA